MRRGPRPDSQIPKKPVARTPLPGSLRYRYGQPPKGVEAAPRRPVRARPLHTARPLPSNVEAPESGDDWRVLWGWLKESWVELRTNPRLFVTRIVEFVQTFGDEEE